jgi:hypothetical protein
MSAGLGGFAVAGLGTAFLCITILVLNSVATQRTRTMSVECRLPAACSRTASV